MIRPVIHNNNSTKFKNAMRRLISGVSIITASRDNDLAGLTVTSAISLSAEPPTILFAINRSSSSWPVFSQCKHFCVNILHSNQADIAAQFSGRSGLTGRDRFESADWTSMISGAQGLVGALAMIDCVVEEIIERHSHAIILGAVREVRNGHEFGQGLIYGDGRFGSPCM